ncbi:MAG: transposase [Verrucomicrobiales bacterium]|nr:transposase [Verrucomicrobiales bacterium]
MARPLRVEFPGARHHVTARGNERRNIFRDDRDRRHFVELLAELPDRFGLRVVAWVLMDNHYHLLVETPEGPLSRPCQWLNVAYSVWFNRRHERSGHLFQGRFKSVVVDESKWLEVARYIHLNPVRVAALGLGKQDRHRQSTAAARDPGATLVGKRLVCLRQYRWSSYRAYAGLVSMPAWIAADGLIRLSGGRTRTEALRALRVYHEEPLREGRLEPVWENLVAGAILGSTEFVDRLKRSLRGVSKEISKAGAIAERASWERIVAAVEAEHGGSWADFRDAYGDWGRDVALYVGRRQGRMTLRELGNRAGGLGVAATGQAVSRVGRAVRKGGETARRVRLIENRVLEIERYGL